MIGPASITFSGEDWRWPVALGLLVAAGLVVWSYRGTPGPRRWLCAGLKSLGLVLLALCVLEPQWTRQRARPGANLLAVMADNSGSLQVLDEGAAEPRTAQLKSVLDPARSAWQATLADVFEVRRYTFDQRVQNVTDFSPLTFDGRASALGSALHTLVDRFHGRPLAGVVLLTDGNATDLAAAPMDWAGLPPVYPVVIGGKGPARDLSVQKISVTQTAFEDAPVTVQAEVATTGFSGATIVAKLIDAAGKVVQEEKRQVAPGSSMSAFRFQVKTAVAGLSFYQFSARDADENAETTREATLANNQRVIVVDRGQGPYRILYVSGRPNWEYKFLSRALLSDAQVELVGLIRVARREPKFSFLGRAGETSNPLFRGFGAQSREEAGSYDQPVLARLNPRDELELRSGFPRIPEDLFCYHAVIVDDLESEFFSHDQSALAQRFVSERGGGFLMLGGMESFEEGGYARTPIGDMLPVRLDRAATAPAGGPVTFDLDREGWLQAWARLRENESDEQSRLAGMPPLQVLNRVRDVKPGAAVIATAADATGRKAPALVVQRFGRGRTAALTIGDMWRWGMRSPEAREDMEKSWRQLVRWLVADVPGRVALSVEPKAADPNGAMDLQVRVRDPKFLPVENASVAIEVEPVRFDAAAATGPPPPTAALTLQAEPSLDEPGLYVATYVPRETAGYKVTARAINSAGAEEGRASAGWATDLAAQEFRSLTPDRALLENLARKTGGAVIEPSGLEALAARLPLEKAPLMEPYTEPLWHTPWVFLTAIGCLVAEWGLRRTPGIAMTKACLAALLLLSPVMAEVEPPVPAVRTTMILVKGAAGEAEFGARFETQLEAWKKAASGADAETIVVADGEAGATDRTRLEKLLTGAPPDGPAELWIVLMGHGTWDGKEARFNLEGPDLSATDLAAWLRPIKRPLVVINTASCSAPFLSALASPGRVLITATRSGSERNYARLGEHLAAVLGDPTADYDQDGRVSLLEWFLSAAARTAEFYKKEGRIATEHALIDDNGDGKGTPADWFRGLRATKKSKDNTPLDGSRAHQRHLMPDPSTREMTADQLAARDTIENELAALRERKSTLPEPEYYTLLESLLLRLAEIYE